VKNAAIDFATFIGIYIIATPPSLLSLVPGGLGVLETTLLLMPCTEVDSHQTMIVILCYIVSLAMSARTAFSKPIGQIYIKCSAIGRSVRFAKLDGWSRRE
jgi:hypothetical protein